ncbi:MULTISPECIES: hypothetical protein [Nitrosomonas]|uniref:Uncharacterized protein n=1 Tax=Nitrosomonas communis TaxID=44574 RepID=A0A0F7KCZ1_9PROT|nr:MULTISPECIES: hypothetical protein [Nitrosomonas]AKH36659.1 hypothetical protein AAW31_00625 [Nitrosomonas communis]UVS61701.1 hypothetical protein NX761_00670 [Nitrosomonas sp. PLL12]
MRQGSQDCTTSTDAFRNYSTDRQLPMPLRVQPGVTHYASREVLIFYSDHLRAHAFEKRVILNIIALEGKLI